MSHVWVTSADGDLLRADQIRQLNTVEGLRAVLIGGSQFLLADIDTRQECVEAARELSAAIATAENRDEWAEITVVSGGPGWTVEVDSTPQPLSDAAGRGSR
jgi:hypothetical protein